MSNMKVCPLCKKENTEDSSICVYCGFDLNPTFSTESDKVPDWLSTFREETNDIANDPKELISDPHKNEQPTDNEPDWLARIRERKINDQESKPIFDDFNFNVNGHVQPKGTDELIDAFRSNDSESKVDERETDSLITNFRKTDEEIDFSQLERENSDFIPENLVNNINDSQNDDWISKLKSGVFSFEEDQTIENNNIDDKEQFPEWLPISKNDFSDKEPAIENIKEEFPEWISKFRNDQNPILDNSDNKDENKLPDWIQNETFSSDIDASDNENEIVDFEFEEGAFEQNKSETEDVIIPSWISETDFSSSELDVEPNNDAEISTFDTEQKHEINHVEKELDLINSSDNQPPFIENLVISDQEFQTNPINRNNDSDSPDMSSVSPFQIEEIPEWLDKGDEEYFSTNFFDDMQIEPEKTTESGQEIQPGELPSWLKAMRPLEAVVPIVSKKQESRQIEKSGPLAGLQGVLSSHQFNNLSAPPPIQAISIDISDKQKKQIEILDILFSNESEPITKAKPKGITVEKIIQLIIPLALIAILAYSYLFPSMNLNKPTVFPSETVRFATIVNGLLLNQTSPPKILTIVESDGASIAELRIVTNDILERLMLKNSYLSVISTNPNGSLLAMNLIQDIASKSNNYDINNLANFGYLPGEQNGVQSFIQSPTETVSLNTNNENIWETPALSGISSFSQFDAVLIITDDSDSAKTWIEQIHALKPGTTTLVAATAQAIPLLKPYIDSNQIDGLVGGLYGSYSYSELIQTENSIQEKYWKMQKVGLYAFILLIILGGIWQTLVIFLGRRIKNNQGSN